MQDAWDFRAGLSVERGSVFVVMCLHRSAVLSRGLKQVTSASLTSSVFIERQEPCTKALPGLCLEILLTAGQEA